MAASDGIDRRRNAIRKRIAELDKRIAKDANEFNRVLHELVSLKVEADALLVVKKCVIDLFSNIVQKTPVDTGRARASWMFGIGVDPSGKRPEGTYDANEISRNISQAMSEIISAPADVVWYISNHLEYIEALEVGWSKQQPHGMVRLALQEFTARLQQELNKK